MSRAPHSVVADEDRHLLLAGVIGGLNVHRARDDRPARRRTPRCWPWPRDRQHQIAAPDRIEIEELLAATLNSWRIRATAPASASRPKRSKRSALTTSAGGMESIMAVVGYPGMHVPTRLSYARGGEGLIQAWIQLTISAMPTSLNGRLVAGPSATTLNVTSYLAVVRGDQDAHACGREELYSGEVDDQAGRLLREGAVDRGFEFGRGQHVDDTGRRHDGDPPTQRSVTTQSEEAVAPSAPVMPSAAARPRLTFHVRPLYAYCRSTFEDPGGAHLSLAQAAP